MDVKIDEEFQLLCPPLSDDERQMLEDSILESGVREPLCVWNGIIVDGHHRYAICKKHKLRFKTHEVTLADRQHARQWIIENQMARRNLSPLQASYLRGVFYNMHKQRPGGNRKGTEPQGATIEWVAERFKVCKTTIHWDVQLTEAVQKLHPDARRFVMDKAVIARRSHVVSLSQLAPDAQCEVVTYLERERGKLADVMLELRGPKQAGFHTIKCKSCGGTLAPGIVTCLKCDMDAGKVREKLKPKGAVPNQKKPLGEDDERYQGMIAQRIEEARQAKAAQDEIEYHANWLIGAISTDGVRQGSLGHKALVKLQKLLSETVGKGKFARSSA